MPTNRVPLHRRRRHLTWAEEMSLEWGEAEHPVIAFRTDQERREAWERHRDYLMARCDRGFRPQAWWDYDCPIRRPRDREYDKAALWEAGLLTPEEVTELEADWRGHFEHANEPDWIGFCKGQKPGTTQAWWLYGAQGRRAHYRWAGIPHALIQKWTEERKRRSKTIRRRAKHAAQEAAAPQADTPPSTPPETPPLIG
jgi:hypothetical protein